MGPTNVSISLTLLLEIYNFPKLPICSVGRYSSQAYCCNSSHNSFAVSKSGSNSIAFIISKMYESFTPPAQEELKEINCGGILTILDPETVTSQDPSSLSFPVISTTVGQS